MCVPYICDSVRGGTHGQIKRRLAPAATRSGRCGRLKCCLRYEYDTYEQLQKELPAVGSNILTGKGRGRVLAHEILANQLLVEMEDHRRVLVPASDVLSVLGSGASALPQ